MSPEIIIRPARETDLPAIHALVRALAEYEREPEAVVTTPEIYLEDFRQGRFESHVAEHEGRIVGTTIFYWAYSTWKGCMLYLEDFVVQADYRRYGVGQRLFDTFVEEARRRDCSLVKWQVLDWNEPALAFYRKNEAIIETDWWNGKIFLKEWPR